MKSIKKYSFEPNRKQFLATFLVSSLMLIFLIGALISPQLEVSTYMFFMLSEITVIFNFIIWKNYKRNDLPELKSVMIQDSENLN